MIAKTNSASVLGIDAHLVDVEVDVSIGLSTFNIVGLPDGTIKDSRDRVTAAVTNSGFNFPVRRIVVNLAPAALRKNWFWVRPSDCPGFAQHSTFFSSASIGKGYGGRRAFA